MTKRGFDILAATLGLVVCLPLFLVVAILVRRDSRGPILFKQVRIGRGGKPFVLYKFRTMIHRPSQPGSRITVGDDARNTRIGRVLRQYNIDELPQLWNVLKGDMSLVGPRPELPAYVEMFKDAYRELLAVRPGLTDYATLHFMSESSVLGRAEDPQKEYVNRILPEKIRLSRLYVANVSLLVDLALIIETVTRIAGVRIPLVVTSGRESADSGSYVADALARFLSAHRVFIVVGTHLSLVAVAYTLAFLLRFDWRIPEPQVALLVQTLPWMLMGRGLLFLPFRLYEGLWRYTSVWDLRNIVASVCVSTPICYLPLRWMLGPSNYLLTIAALDTLLLVLLLSGVRLVRKLGAEVGLNLASKPVVLVGAGNTGEMVARDLKRNPSYGYEPVGFVDDDPDKVGRCIHGIRVVGTCAELARVLAKHRPEEIWITVPGQQSGVVRRVLRTSGSERLPIRMLPGSRLAGDAAAAVAHVQPLTIANLLGREPVRLDAKPVQRLLTGRRVCVSGAGGSIGSELCRQIARHQPSELVLLERYENNLYQIEAELADVMDRARLHPVLADIADAARMENLMAEYRPEVVLHAAAYKHVPLLEANVCAAVRNNIRGTRVLAAAASRADVDRFVMISTDKAVSPSSVMGATKRVSELIVQALGGTTCTRFVTVRFGNVLGSNGSVVPRFLDQIRKGGPVTVTHPEARRYFMLISEASELVLQAAALGEPRGTYLLEMGEQTRILDLAWNLIRLSGFVPETEISIAFTGLRPGEKLSEDLVGLEEWCRPSTIPKVLEVTSDAMPASPWLAERIARLEEAALLNDTALTMSLLSELVPTLADHHPSEPSHGARPVLGSAPLASPVVGVGPMYHRGNLDPF